MLRRIFTGATAGGTVAAQTDQEGDL